MDLLKKARRKLLSAKRRGNEQDFTGLTVEEPSPTNPACQHKANSRCLRNYTPLCCSCYGGMIPEHYCMQCRNYWQIGRTTQAVPQQLASQNCQHKAGSRCLRNYTPLCCSCYGGMLPAHYCMQCRSYWQTGRRTRDI